MRNNREFDAITKEIEYQELEIELAEKRLKEYSAGVKTQETQLEEAEAQTRTLADLAAKKSRAGGHRGRDRTAGRRVRSAGRPR